MPTEMVGRTAELAVLQDALRRAQAGEPALCLVSGESGVGKACLAQAFVEAATARGGRALVGGCVPAAAGEVPFAPVLEAFRSVPDNVCSSARAPDASAGRPVLLAPRERCEPSRSLIEPLANGSPP